MSTNETKHFILRCIAYPGDSDGNDGYYAVCIDLNLVSWRSSIDEAVNSLNDAIHGYLETVKDIVEDEKELKQLLHRPAAFWPYRAIYHYAALVKALPRLGKQKNSVLFDSPVDYPYSSAAA